MSDGTKNTISAYLGPEFQQKLIWQLLVEPDFAKNVLPNISVEYFDDPYLKRLFIIMLEYYKEHDKVPNLQNGSIDDAIYKYKLSTNDIEGEVLKGKLDQIKLWDERVINKDQLYDGDVVRKEAINFIKQQEYRKLGEYILNRIKSGEIKSTKFNFEIEEKINKIYHIGDEDDYGVDVIDNIDDVLKEEFRETIPTGIEVIDVLTGNGLGKGEIGLILAPSGVGKTTALTKIANTAFNNGKKVLQIIFEDTVKQIQRKHYAIWSKVKQSEINENRDIVKQKTLKKYKEYKKKGGKLDIVRFSQENTTLYDIKRWINRQYKKFGYKYDIIILDYLDCLEPNRREKELLSAELSIIKSFEAMAAEYDIPCWSAIQTNRTGFNVEFVDAQNTGGNIKRIQKSHFVMSIAKPDKADNINIANIKIVKARFVQDGYEFKHCIFNNDSLEIRIPDEKKYLAGINVKKYNDTDIEKIENKAENLGDESLLHAKISNAIDSGSPTTGDFNNLKLKEGVMDEFKSETPLNENIKKQIKSHKSFTDEMDNDDPSQMEIPRESDEIFVEKDNDIKKLINQIDTGINDEQPKHLDFLKKRRDEQGDILKK